jgi:hypothetical protein
MAMAHSLKAALGAANARRRKWLRLVFTAARRESRRMANAAARDEGEGFVDVLVKMLIVVVVGAALLAIMRTAVPQLFTDMVNKIRGIFEL